MTELIIKAGGVTFGAQLEEEDAPNTCAMFRKLLPYTGQIVHVRWSGEGVWIPLGDEDFGVKYENHTSHAGPGQILLYPGGISETEILLAYGGVCFACRRSSTPTLPSGVLRGRGICSWGSSFGECGPT